MTTMNELAIEQARALTEQLSGPMPISAAKNGWREETWSKWGKIFGDIACSLTDGREVDQAFISRALDFDGVHGGPILDDAAKLSSQIRGARG